MNSSLIGLPPGEQSFILQGPVGDLETSVTIPETHKNISAIICHPHSLHGGTMNNKVVTTLAKLFNEMGAVVVRFNFRGVGKSAGEFDHGIGESEDLRFIISWVLKQYPETKLCLTGFSFGSYVSYRVSGDINPALLISVAPPVSHFEYQEIKLPTCPWIIVQGEEDEVVDPLKVFDWVDHLPRSVNLLRFPNTGHFFHGQLIQLREKLKPLVENFLL